MNPLAIAADPNEGGFFGPSPIRRAEQRAPLTLEDVFGSKAKARAFNWRERNRERLRAQHAAYRAANADAIRARRTAERARKKAEQLSAREQRNEALRARLSDPSAAVLLGIAAPVPDTCTR